MSGDHTIHESVVSLEADMRRSIVYVGIVTFHSAVFISRCLNALQKQTYTQVRIIVLDNDSGDEIRKMMKPYKTAVTFIQNDTNVGYGAGHNRIISSVRLRDHDYYLSLNPDAILGPEYIAKLVIAIRTHNVGWATGKLYRNIKTKELYSVGHAIQRDGYTFNIGYDMKDIGQYNVSRHVFGAPGAAAMYSGKLINAISQEGSFFDPTMFLYYEDVDVDWRAQRAGFRCSYEPKATATHTGGLFPKHFEAEVLANRYYTVLKNAEASSLMLYNVPVMFIHVLFRIFVTPATGLALIRKLFIKGPTALRLRYRSSAQCSMRYWNAQAVHELTFQPRNVIGRLSNFITLKNGK